MGIKLDVGGGRNPAPGFKVLDIEDRPGVDYVCPAWKTPLKDNSVSEINARHFLEHLTLEEAKKTMVEWLRILEPGAFATVTVPDILYHARQLTMPGRSQFVPQSNFEHAMAGFYGWQKQGETMGHRYGYTRTTLLELMTHHGFNTIAMPSRKCDIVVHARKPK